MEKINVLLIIGALSRNSGGPFYSVPSLGKKINKNSNSADVTLMGYTDEFYSQDKNNFYPLKIVSYSPKLLRKFAFSNSLLKLYKSTLADIVDLNLIWTYNSIVALRLFKSRQIPFIITPRGMLDSWALNNNKITKKVFYYLWEKNVFENAKAFRALNSNEAYSISNVINSKPIFIVPNGIDLPADIYTKDKVPEWYLSSFKYMLFMGRIHKKKGIYELLEAWNKVILDSSSDSWKLVIAGWGEDNDVSIIEKFVQNNNLSDKIIFIGSMYGEQKHTLLKLCNAFILPSYSEGLPMAVLEAWSYGIPTLITKECNLEDSFKYIFSIPIENEKHKLAISIIDFIKHYHNRFTYYDLSREYVAKNFSWDKIAQDMVRIYEYCLNLGPIPTDLLYQKTYK